MNPEDEDEMYTAKFIVWIRSPDGWSHNSFDSETQAMRCVLGLNSEEEYYVTGPALRVEIVARLEETK